MQSQVQRRRQLDALRPRQPRNDVNAGSLPKEHEAGVEPQAPETDVEARINDHLKRCAYRDLI